MFSNVEIKLFNYFKYSFIQHHQKRLIKKQFNFCIIINFNNKIKSIGKYSKIHKYQDNKLKIDLK